MYQNYRHPEAYYRYLDVNVEFSTIARLEQDKSRDVRSNNIVKHKQAL